MATALGGKIVPHLWYAQEAEEAAAFYVSVFPGSSIDRVNALPVDSPSGPGGAVRWVEFTLLGQPFQALSAGAMDPFNHAISLVVLCDDQAEVNRFWEALLAGGKAEQCGWLKDRFGVSWQVVPRILNELLLDPDRAKARRVAEAMMKMGKLEVDGLLAAARAP